MLLSTSMVLQDPFDLIVIKVFTYIFQKKINNIWKKFIFLAELAWNDTFEFDHKTDTALLCSS